jgi:hypothetical protein
MAASLGRVRCRVAGCHHSLAPAPALGRQAGQPCGPCLGRGRPRVCCYPKHGLRLSCPLACRQATVEPGPAGGQAGVEPGPTGVAHMILGRCRWGCRGRTRRSYHAPAAHWAGEPGQASLLHPPALGSPLPPCPTATSCQARAWPALLEAWGQNPQQALPPASRVARRGARRGRRGLGRGPYGAADGPHASLWRQLAGACRRADAPRESVEAHVPVCTRKGSVDAGEGGRADAEGRTRKGGRGRGRA